MADSTSESSDEPDLFIGIALSGGGFRSAAFSNGALTELRKLKLCVYKERDSKREDSVKVLIHESGQNCHNPDEKSYIEIVNGTILESADAISAVSGGAIAGAYYALNNNVGTSDVGDNFRLKVLHGIDKFKKSLIPGILDLPNLFWDLFIKEGVIDISRPITYYDGIFESKTLGDLETAGEGIARTHHADVPGKVRRNVPLLIHATDLTTESIFTFAANDLSCISKLDENWKKIRVSEAIGASSALPGLIAPVRLPNNNDPAKATEECNRFFGNKSIRRDVVLVDGGIYDNLALDGLLRYFVNQKRIKKLADETKALILVFNAETTSRFTNAGADTDQFPVAQVLNQSIGLLMNNRVDVSENLFSMLEATGIKVIDISFQDLINDTSLRPMGEKREADLFEVGGTFDAKSAFEVAHMQARDIEDLNSIRTMFPDVAQIDSVIAAGSLATRYSLRRQLPSALRDLLNRSYAGKCSGLIDVSQEYCWPRGWLVNNPFESTMKVRLSEVQEANEEHLQHNIEVAKEQLDRFFETLPARLHTIEDPEQRIEFYSPEWNVAQVIKRLDRPFPFHKDKGLAKKFIKLARELKEKITVKGEIDDLEVSLTLAKSQGLIAGELLDPSAPEWNCGEYSTLPHCYSLVGILYLDAARKASDRLRLDPQCDVARDRDCESSRLLLKQALIFKVRGKALLEYAARETFHDAQASYMYSIVKWLDGQAELKDAKRTYEIVKSETDQLKKEVDRTEETNGDLSVEEAKKMEQIREQHLESQNSLNQTVNQYMYFAAITGDIGADTTVMASHFEEIIKQSEHDLATKKIEEMKSKISFIALKDCLAEEKPSRDDQVAKPEEKLKSNKCVNRESEPQGIPAAIAKLKEELDKATKSRERVEEAVNTFTSTKLIYEYVGRLRELKRAVKADNFNAIYKSIGESFSTLVALRASSSDGYNQEVITGLSFSQIAIRWLGEEEAFLGKLPSRFHGRAK